MNGRIKKIMAVLLALTLVMTGVQWPEKGAEAAKDSTGQNQNTSVDTDITISAKNSFGTLLKGTMDFEQAEQKENNGYNVFSIEIENNTASVQMETMKDCTLVVGIYEENEITMITSASKAVSTKDKSVTLSFDKALPSYFYIKAFLVDDTMHPLCIVYENSNYTREMQEFFAKTTKDFDEEKVLNLDSDNTNNFAVYGKDTKIISHTSNINQLVYSKDGTYVFENIDDTVSSLKKNDIFAYKQDNGEVLLVKINNITIEETTATITEKDTSMEEVFDYVKIDTQSDLGDASIDASTCGEGITYEGLKQGNESRKTSGRKSLEMDRDVTQHYNLGNASLGNDTAKISGSMDFSLTCYAKLYVVNAKKYAEIRFDYVLNNNITVKVSYNDNIALTEITFKPFMGAVTVTVTPSFHVELNIEGTVNANVSGRVGYVAEEGKIRNLTEKPIVDTNCTVDGSLYLGLALTPEIYLIDEKVAMLSMTAEVGARIELHLSKLKENVKHTCGICFEGDISFKYDLTFEAKFLNSDSLNPKYNKTDTIKITDYYYSADHNEFGTGTCPYKLFKISVKVCDVNNKPVSSAFVNNDSLTDENGNVALWLKSDTYKITASKDGLGKAEKDLMVTEPVKITLNLREVLDGTEDLDRTDDGTNVYFGRFYQKKVIDEEQIKALESVEFSKVDEDTNSEARDNLSTAVIGDVKYARKGKYGHSYYKETPIAWKIIDDDGTYYTLLSKKILMWSSYDDFWPRSTIRRKLNGRFFDTAFSEGEKADIADTTISTTEISYEDVYIDHENNVIVDTVTDKVYLLSLDDVINPKYGFSDNKEEETEARTAYTAQYVDDEEKSAPYWLLGPNYWFYGMLHGEYMTSHGRVDKWNLVTGAVSNEMGVRPVIRVKKTSPSLFTKADVLQKTGSFQKTAKTESMKTKSSKVADAGDRKKVSVKTFTDLKPDTIYNFYAMKSKEAENMWDSDNLLYITQEKSDKNGVLNAIYETGQNVGEVEAFVMPLRKSVRDAEVNFNTWIRYDEKQHIINPPVVIQGVRLKEGTDYEISGDYSATEEGDYYITINGIGDYTDSITISYTISSLDKPKETPEPTPVPTLEPTPEVTLRPTDAPPEDPLETTTPEPTITPDIPTTTPTHTTDTVTPSKVKMPGKVTGVVIKAKTGKKMTVQWTKKKDVSGYQIQYAQNKAFTTKKKSIRVGKSTKKKTITKLTKGKTYYVRVRAYKKTSSGKKYGKWSAVKKIIMKK